MARHIIAPPPTWEFLMNSMVEARGKDAECFLVEPADGIVEILPDNIDFIGKIDLQSVAQKRPAGYNVWCWFHDPDGR